MEIIYQVRKNLHERSKESLMDLQDWNLSVNGLYERLCDAQYRTNCAMGFRPTEAHRVLIGSVNPRRSRAYRQIQRPIDCLRARATACWIK